MKSVDSQTDACKPNKQKLEIKITAAHKIALDHSLISFQGPSHPAYCTGPLLMHRVSEQKMFMGTLETIGAGNQDDAITKK